MALSTVLPVFVKCHKDPCTTSLTGAFPSKALDFPIWINRVIFQCCKFFPDISTILRVEAVTSCAYAWSSWVLYTVSSFSSWHLLRDWRPDSQSHLGKYYNLPLSSACWLRNEKAIRRHQHSWIANRRASVPATVFESTSWRPEYIRRCDSIGKLVFALMRDLAWAMESRA